MISKRLAIPRFSNKKIILPLAILTGSFFVSGCPSENTNPENSGSPGLSQPISAIKYSLNSEVVSLDPIKVTDDASRLVSTQILETLVNFDKNLQMKPGLAKLWEPINGGKEWKFELRKNILFHDDISLQGKPRYVSSGDVLFSLERMLSPKTGTLGAFILTDILEGAQEFLDGKASTISGIKVIDSDTIVFRLKKPYALFPARLSLPFSAIIPKESVSYYGKEWGLHPIGTGPYRFKTWNISTGEISLEKNGKYWRNPTSLYQSVNYKIIKSDATQLAHFTQKKLDVFEVTPAIANQVFDTSGKTKDLFMAAQIKQSPTLTAHFIGFNFQKALLKDKNFRLAFNYALDKKLLTKTVLNGLAVPATGPLVPPLSGSSEIPLYDQDANKAKKLLAQSSYKGQELVYVTDNSAQSVAIAEFIQSQLKTIGIKINIDKNPESVWVDKLTKGQFDLGKLYFAFDYPSPDNGMTQFLKKNFAPIGPNFLRWENPKFETLYEKSLSETDSAKSQTLFKEMNNMIRDEAPWIFLFYPVRTLMIQKNVPKIEISPLSFSLFLTE